MLVVIIEAGLLVLLLLFALGAWLSQRQATRLDAQAIDAYLALPYTVRLHEHRQGATALLAEWPECTATAPTREQALQEMRRRQRRLTAAALREKRAIPLP